MALIENTFFTSAYIITIEESLSVYISPCNIIIELRKAQRETEGDYFMIYYSSF